MVPAFMKTLRFDQRPDFLDYLENSPVRGERLRREAALSEPLHRQDRFELDGRCAACDRPRRFLVDRRYGAHRTVDGWIPNWRERLVCRSCGLNNRQRAMAHALQEAVAARAPAPQPPKLYAMEQVSPLFGWIVTKLAVRCTGSEYRDQQAGMLVRAWSRLRHAGHRIRYEDAQALTFGDGQFDFLVSNDVLEHVDDPGAALTEMFRVLNPGGELFLTMPFRHDRDHSVRRAAMTGSGVKHLLPPEYHGNPLSRSASLVFHDFGWDFLEGLRSAGFRDACLQLYWSERYAYLGDPQYYFHAVRPGPRSGNRSADGAVALSPDR
jgi:SAM-dependent methyltransferase